jgi:hypothetical protein
VTNLILRSDFKAAVFKLSPTKNCNVLFNTKVQEYVCMTKNCPCLVRAGHATKSNKWKELKYKSAHLDTCMPKTDIDGQALVVNPGFEAAVLLTVPPL